MTDNRKVKDITGSILMSTQTLKQVRYVGIIWIDINSTNSMQLTAGMSMKQSVQSDKWD